MSNRPQALSRFGASMGVKPGQMISGTAGVWTNVTPAGVSLALDVTASPNWTGHMGTDAYGVAGLCGDPSRQNVAYFGAAQQGMWKTTDFGLTWAKCNTGPGGSILDGHCWSIAIPSTGDYILANNGYGTNGGCYRSTDGGASWTQVISGDVNYITISDTDPLHVFALPHGPDDATGNWNESFDGGRTWLNHGAETPGIFGDGAFLNDQTYITQTPNGLFRGTCPGYGQAWTWTENALQLSGPHGGTRMMRDGVNGYFYVGGQEVASGRGRIYRCTLADGGQNWTQLDDSTGGSYGPATIFASQSKIYAQGNYATHDPYGPIAIVADRANAGAGLWSIFSLHASMNNGAHAACTRTDGLRTVLLCSNENAGVWRYIE